MPTAQFPPDDFHLRLLHALQSRKTSFIIIFDSDSRGNSKFPLESEKQLTPLTPKVKSVDISILREELISPDSSEFNWRDYYSRSLRALMGDFDEIPPGE